MHQYLRAIGFTNPPKRIEIFNLIKEGISKNPAYRAYTTNVEEENSLLAQYDIALGERIGISVCGQFDDSDEFYPEYYYPYLDPRDISTEEEIEVERRVDNNSFVGIVDDYKVGISLMYRVRNSIEYIKNAYVNEDPLAGATSYLSALALEGTVLLPIHKTVEERMLQESADYDRAQLVREARDGNERAFQTLTLADMDTYQNIMAQLPKEDIYSLVDSYVMPTGAECELYYVLGEIYEIVTTQNRITGEEVVILQIEANSIGLSVAINRKDLLGEPAVGRRFKGRIWLQGRICFANSEN